MVGSIIRPVPGCRAGDRNPGLSHRPDMKRRRRERVDDVNVRWTEDVSAAEARPTSCTRRPVMVAIHAAEDCCRRV